jgi:hypothetical protein
MADDAIYLQIKGQEYIEETLGKHFLNQALFDLYPDTGSYDVLGNQIKFGIHPFSLEHTPQSKEDKEDNEEEDDGV